VSLTDKQRKVIEQWLDDCQNQRVRIDDRQLTMEECELLQSVIEEIAGDLEMV
jgi:transposase